jgi:hypothetical protein
MDDDARAALALALELVERCRSPAQLRLAEPGFARIFFDLEERRELERWVVARRLSLGSELLTGGDEILSGMGGFRMSQDDRAARAGRYAGQYLVDGVYTQLLGLCRGILADGHLHDAEIVALDQWMSTMGHLVPEWPGQVLARRVKAILADGEVDDGERADLQAFLEQAAGVEGTERFDAPTTLPLTRPAPHVEFHGRHFCLTGTFIYGPRRLVEAAIVEQGGTLTRNVETRTNYLVIGGTITPSWKYGTHGLKIESAARSAETGHPIAIISEGHWSSSLC